MQAALDRTLEDDVASHLLVIEGKRKPWEKATRERAREVLKELCRKLPEIYLHPPKYEDLIPLNPTLIIKEILRAKFEEPEKLHRRPSEGAHSNKQMSELAGVMDRRIRTISVSRSFSMEVRRFTAAHEIGHWVLHPSEVYHRDRPLTGQELECKKRPPGERQADLFAAELLMPTRFLVRTFFNRFGGPIDGNELDEGLLFWLSAGCKREIDISRFSKWERRERSKYIAELTSYRSRHFRSLAEYFGVSVTAMAIQLEDLDLVK